MNFKVEKIDHVGIAVRSIEDVVKIYSDLMNLEVGKMEELETRGLRIQVFRVGESRFEILEPTREESEISKFLERRGEGIHHIALRVDDIEKAFNRAKELGFKVIGDSIQKGAGGRRVFFLHPKGTAGVLFEFVEGGMEDEG